MIEEIESDLKGRYAGKYIGYTIQYGEPLVVAVCDSMKSLISEFEKFGERRDISSYFRYILP